jgi:hypothetical protein
MLYTSSVFSLEDGDEMFLQKVVTTSQMTLFHNPEDSKIIIKQIIQDKIKN